MRKLLITLISVATAVAMSSAAPAAAQGTLKVAIPSNVNTFDPAKTKIGEEYIINFLVYSGLTELDGGKVNPDLAESWTASTDQKTWTFTLRKGVKFHDGREFDFGDVKATIERIMDKATGSIARVNFDIVSAIDAPDKYTVVFHLKIPYSGFADILGDRQVRIVPKDKLDSSPTSRTAPDPLNLSNTSPATASTLKRTRTTTSPASLNSTKSTFASCRKPRHASRRSTPARSTSFGIYRLK